MLEGSPHVGEELCSIGGKRRGPQYPLPVAVALKFTVHVDSYLAARSGVK